MKLLEYQAKTLYKKYGLPVMRSALLTDGGSAAGTLAKAGLSYPLVLKAQVPVGGRGKAGGIRFAEDPSEAGRISGELLHSQLKGHTIECLLAEEKAESSAEWYLSILLDRQSGGPRVIFSVRGGVDIEETAAYNPEAVVQAAVNPLTGITDYLLRYICTRGGVPEGQREALGGLLRALYRLFMEQACLLVEINPLCVKPDGSLLALDGKAEIDDAALYRLPEVKEFGKLLREPPLVEEARSWGFLYIPIRENGRVAVMSNGSGMLMSMIDLLSKEGVSVGSALDLGGGATADRIREAVRISLSTPGVKALFISIFGGITRCDEVAKGIRDALADTAGGRPVVVRMEGTNRAAGLEIVAKTPGAVSVGSITQGVAALAGRGLA